jgi:hypothetical protein
MSSSARSGRPRKGDSTALALMIGMVLAVAVTAGAAFHSAGSGALQAGLKALGFGRDTEIQAEQRRQAHNLSELERIINRMDNEIGGLTTRMGRAESVDSATGQRLGALDHGIAGLATDVKDLRARAEAGGGEGWKKPVEHLNTAVTGARSDIISLRSSIDAFEQTRRADIGNLNRRVERLEQALTARDATSSIPAPPARSGERDGSVMDLFGLRGSGAQSGHVIDMGTPSN